MNKKVSQRTAEVVGGITFFLVGMVIWVGCETPPERLNSPPQGATERTSDMSDTYVFMVDNALLEEMSMAPVHFVPHTFELNATGVRRLARYAEILQVYGGTLRYSGVTDEESLAEGRIDQMRGFLIAQGLADDQFDIMRAMAGNSDMRASEAIAARAASTGGASEEGGEEEGMDLSAMLGGKGKK